MRISRRRRGAGMTEYIILVGLIAILLAGIVERYKVQIDVTIRGTEGAFARHNIGGGAPSGNVPKNPAKGQTYTDSSGKQWTWNGSAWV